MRLIAQIFLTSLIVVKVVLGSLFIYSAHLDPLFSEGNAIASETVQKNHEAVTPQNEPVAGDGAETIDLNYLINKKAQLEREEERLEKKRAELKAIQEELNDKIATLTQLRNEMRAMMDRRQAVEGQKIKKLIKAYSAMKPQKAANLIEKLETGFAIELLSNMKGEVVGEILSFVDTEKGARISEALGKKR